MALYTFVLMELMKRKSEDDAEAAAKHELEILGKLGSLTFEELIKREREEEE